jgi:ribonucleoside-diphosphate reductase beta chain
MDIWKMVKTIEANTWYTHEVDLTKDVAHWNKLTDNERYFLKNVIGFFAFSDGIVNENLATNFYREVQIPEARHFYGFQIAQEHVHSEQYSLLIDEYIKDLTEKTQLFNSIMEIPCVKKKAEWAINWIEKGANDRTYFNERLVAFAVVEGIFFSGSFCAIFWLKSRKLMPGLCLSNDFISRDEKLHCDFAILLYSKLKNKLSKERIYEIFSSAVDIEKQFITESIPCNLIGMNSVSMISYIEYTADNLLNQLGYPKLYNSVNPFDFMNMISTDTKVNFFESKEFNYQIAGSKNGMTYNEMDDNY